MRLLIPVVILQVVACAVRTASTDPCAVSVNWRINQSSTIPNIMQNGIYTNVETEFEIFKNTCGSPTSGYFSRNTDSVEITSGRVTIKDTNNTASSNQSSQYSFNKDGSGKVLSAGLALIINATAGEKAIDVCIDIGASVISGGVGSIEGNRIIINDTIAWNGKDCYFNYLWGNSIPSLQGGAFLPR